MATKSQPHTSGLFGQLNREWLTLAADPATHDELHRWADAEPALADVKGIRDLPAAARGDADGVLGALLRLHHNGRRLAGRAVLQVMLPKVVLLAHSQLASMSPEDAASSAVTCMLQAIDKYASRVSGPNGRRKLATTLAMECLHHLTRCSWRTPSATAETAVGLQPARSGDHERRLADDRVPFCDDTVLVHTVLVDAVDQQVITRTDAQMLAQVYTAVRPNRARVARSLGISEAALRQRCSRAVKALATSRHTLVPEAA